MAGNAVLLKHSPNTPRCARAIERLMGQAGFPDGLVRSLFLSNEQAAAVIGDGRVSGVTLTGSTRAGREVASCAGRHLKTMVMELGDPLRPEVRVGPLARADLRENLEQQVEASRAGGARALCGAERPAASSSTAW